jgi:flavin reductase (DIM6/NTAB) family NADH-FMN oxidoreductase RutF
MVFSSFDKSNFVNFEKRYNALFFNSLSGIKNVCLIGTRDKEGQSNLAIFNSLIHVGSNPPLLGLMIRPDLVDRHTLQNILSTEDYTINLLVKGMEGKAHQTSARYPKTISEFDACGLTESYLEGCKAPFVEESSVKIGMKFREKIDIESNGTHLIVGEITKIQLPEFILNKDGFVDLEAIETIASSGVDAYYSVKLLARYQYAKANQELKKIKNDE